jgi:hypothetical protein
MFVKMAASRQGTGAENPDGSGGQTKAQYGGP